jgi:hypothetical protein
MDTFLNALIKNTKLAIIVIGLLLILMGAGGGFSKLSLTIDGMGWRVALFLMGVVVAGFGALLIWRSSINENVNRESIISECALKISWPINGTALDGHVKIVGTFQKAPPEDRVWVLERSLTTGLYYFNSRPIFEDDNKQWSADYLVGGESGSERLLQVVAVGNAGKALAEYYLKVIKDTGRRVGVETITTDIIPLDNIKLKHK